MNENLFTFEELEAEIKRQGREVSFEYPGYLQVGEIAFGHSVEGENYYSWNDDYQESGQVPPLRTVEEVVREFLRQIEERESA